MADNILGIVRHDGGTEYIWSVPIIYDTRMLFRVETKYTGAGDGYTRLYKDNVLVADYTGPTHYSADSIGPYLKFGLYIAYATSTVEKREIYQRLKYPEEVTSRYARPFNLLLNTLLPKGSSSSGGQAYYVVGETGTGAYVGETGTGAYIQETE